MRRLKLWITAAIAAIAASASTAAATSGHGHGHGAFSKPATLAIIGDTPYDDAQAAAFPGLVAAIDADRSVRTVVHLGDMKSGQPCTDEFFRGRRALFATFDDPFVLTPGDNDWTDCSRPQFGGFVPTERLGSLRHIFYPRPGLARGQRRAMAVHPQSRGRYREFVENVMWTRARTVFSTLHVVGSNNDLDPWFDGAETPQQRAQRLAEFDRRLAADLAWLDRTFALARARRARGVVLAMQANLFLSRLEPGEDVSGFNAIVQRIADLAKRFARPVLLLQGDTHEYFVDQPLAAGSPEHGVATQAPNVTRIVVQGETSAEWLRLRVNPRSANVFSWERRLL